VFAGVSEYNASVSHGTLRQRRYVTGCKDVSTAVSVSNAAIFLIERKDSTRGPASERVG